MKFRSFILLSLLSLSLSVLAQPYHSIFGKNSTTWYTYGENLDVFRTEKREVIGDTIINNKNYKILNGYGDLFLREDTLSGRVWAYSGIDTFFNGTKMEEQLIQDMSLKKGDTIHFSNGIYGGYDTLKVDTVYFVNGIKHIELNRKFQYGLGKGKKLTFIEGIPSNVGFEYKMGPYLAIQPWLLCTFKDGNQVYGSGQCIISSAEDVSINSFIKINPNPTSGKIFIENTSAVKLQNLELYSLSGRKIQALDSKSSSFDIGFLEAGIYYLRYEIDHESYYQKIVLE